MRKIDLTGKRFGKLTVLHQSERKSPRGELYWLCRCDCGNEKEILGNNLRRGLTSSCGDCDCKKINYDLTGQRFEMLTALHRSERRHGYWICRCDCGKLTEVLIHKLLSGHTKSCGCRKITDLSGQRFGRLVVLKRSDKKNKDGQFYWLCHCDCGTEKEILHSSLTEGNALSCGCLHRDTVERKFNKIEALQTNPDRIRYPGKLQKNNTTGTTGVYYLKKEGIYSARIRFKGTAYYLKRSSDINECIAARKEAEEALFGNFLEWYDKTIGSNISDERVAFIEEKKKEKHDGEQ